MHFSRAALAFTLAACLLASRSADALFQACSTDDDCTKATGFRGFTCVGADNGAQGLCKCGSRTDPCTKNFSCGTITLNGVKSAKCICGGASICPWGTACADDGLCRCTKSKSVCNNDTVAANGGTTLCLTGTTCTAVCPKGLTLNEDGSACVKAC